MKEISMTSVANRLSTSEIYGLLIALTGISLAFAIAERSLEMFFVGLLFFGPGFVLHELGHKFTAQAHGCHAEFKIFPLLLGLSILVSFTGFAFVLFGAVYFSHEEDEISVEVVGRVLMSGPLVNIALAGAFLLPLMAGGPILGWIGLWGLCANAFIAAFNLIPCPPLDGYGVFMWNKLYWALGLLSALLLLALAFFVPF
jgi:Zn-dependent protease